MREIQIALCHDGVSRWKFFSALLALCDGIHRSRMVTLTKASDHRSPVVTPTEANDAELWCFFLCLRRRWFQTPSRSLWRHCNGVVLLWYSPHRLCPYHPRLLQWHILPASQPKRKMHMGECVRFSVGLHGNSQIGNMTISWTLSLLLMCFDINVLDFNAANANKATTPTAYPLHKYIFVNKDITWWWNDKMVNCVNSVPCLFYKRKYLLVVECAFFKTSLEFL